MAQHNITGRLAEEEAACYLENNGFTILERNWRSGRHEIDIIAMKDGAIRIVEVKCRKTGNATTPEEALTAKKFTFLQEAAENYIESEGLDCEVRFDLVAVERDGERFMVRYIPDAVYPHW